MNTNTINCFEESRLQNKMLPQEWREQDALDELEEFLQLNWEERSVFFDNGDMSSRQQYLSFIGAKGIRTNNYIGTIVFRGHQLNIFPKMFREDREDNNTDGLNIKHLMKNLVQWLQYCKKMDFPFIRIYSEFEDSENLRELFIRLYIHYVKRSLEYKPFYQYEEKQEDTSSIKGKINFKDYVNYKLPNGSNHQFQCLFSEFVFDNTVNRIIKHTCKYLLNETSSFANKMIIRDILFRLNNVKNQHYVPSDCDMIRLNKLNRHYSVILSMSKMFLLNQTTMYRLGNQESFCFLFPTELLFEGFIGGYIKETLSGMANVRLQASELSLINDVKYDGISLGKAFRMRHDILVEHRDLGLFILDTKYKHLSRFEGNTGVKIKNNIMDEISQSDLYQLIEYATQRDVDSAYLLYPMYRFESEEPKDVVLERKTPQGKVINIHVVRVPFIFEENEDVTKNNLTKTINRIFT